MATLIRVAVVDDEPLACEGIAAMLDTDPELEIVGTFADGAAAVSGIARTRPDLVFLDVQMPELNGFEVLSLLDEEQAPEVVFVTAFDRFAIRAFEVNAIDYVLKPVTEERLAAAVERGKDRVRGRAERSFAKHVGDILRVFGVTGATPEASTAFASPESKIERLLVREAGRVRFIPLRDIDWIEGADYYAKVHVGSATLMLRESLASLEARLDAERFFRIHRSAIVALNRVRELRTDGRSDCFVVLANGVRLKISRGRRAELERALELTRAER